MIFELIVIGMGYLQAMSLYEIIRSMDDPARVTKDYPNMMAWFLFGATVLECESSFPQCLLPTEQRSRHLTGIQLD